MEEKKYMALPDHDYEAHNDRALSQTGFRRGCLRCKLLMRSRKLSLYSAWHGTTSSEPKRPAPGSGEKEK